MAEAFSAGAGAALLAGTLHDGSLGIGMVKEELARMGWRVRI